MQDFYKKIEYLYTFIHLSITYNLLIVFFFKKTFNWLYRNINIYVSWSKMYWIGVKAQLRIPYFTVSPTQTRWSSIKPIKMDSFVLWISIFTQFWPFTKRNLDWYIPYFSQVSFFNNNNILIIRVFFFDAMTLILSLCE